MSAAANDQDFEELLTALVAMLREEHAKSTLLAIQLDLVAEDGSIDVFRRTFPVAGSVLR